MTSMRFCSLVYRGAVVMLLTTALSFGANLDSLREGNADIQSAGPLAFGPDGILFVGDSTGASIIALDTGDRTPAKSAAKINVNGINQKVAAALGTSPDQILLVDAVVNPISKNVYLSVSRGRGPDAIPVILRVDAAGKLTELSLGNINHSKIGLPNAPSFDAERRGRKLRMETITDLEYVDGKVLVAGLSNEEFASRLRTIPFPFQQTNPGAGIGIYHTSHGRFETYSPIRAFVPYDLDGQPHILAAYTCTPLVKIPVSELKPNHKVQGVTIAELGNRNRPLDMIIYQKGGQEYLLMANSSRGVMKLPLSGLEKYPALVEEPVDTAGVPYEIIADLKGVLQLDKFDDNNMMLLIDDSGSLNLRTVQLP